MNFLCRFSAGGCLMQEICKLSIPPAGSSAITLSLPPAVSTFHPFIPLVSSFFESRGLRIDSGPVLRVVVWIDKQPLSLSLSILDRLSRDESEFD